MQFKDALGVTTAEDDVIRAECEEWAGGLLYMDSEERRDGLRDRICANPDAWWRILQELIAQAPDDQVIQRLAYAPLRMTLECGGERLLREAVSIARTSPRMASAVKGWPSRPTNDLYPLFGRAFVVETLIRHYSQHTGFDFWAWQVARNLINDDPPEAWLLILELLHNAPDDGQPIVRATSQCRPWCSPAVCRCIWATCPSGDRALRDEPGASAIVERTKGHQDA